MPIEKRTGIGLAGGRNIAVAHQAPRANARVRCGQDTCQFDQSAVLRFFKSPIVCALQLNTYGKIVDIATPMKLRVARVPSALVDRHELRQASVSGNEEMRGHLQMLYLPKILVHGDIQAIAKQGLYVLSTKAIGRKADAVNYDRVDGGRTRTLVEIGRCDKTRFLDQAGIEI